MACVVTSGRVSIVADMDVRCPRLVGAQEIRALLGGVSRQRVYQLTVRADVPKPVAELAQGKVWQAADVEAWICAHRPPES
jgi:prophage regulatory protein